MQRLCFTLMAGLYAAVSHAQDDALIDIDIDKTEWYENPLLWVAVAAFFIILIVMTRRKRT
ncbi:hypothetical protein [Lewinella sp. IMCC34191]|uniref:hypothetical protein n=1 Tax=Lewinella sp. IMCC34191 TaxID=2259172 RepID=UPI0013005D21|nr:hypothetical protein [Lewinella sp. IMCC34191]